MTVPPGDLTAVIAALRETVGEMADTVAMLTEGPPPRAPLAVIEGDGLDQSAPRGQLHSVPDSRQIAPSSSASARDGQKGDDDAR